VEQSTLLLPTLGRPLVVPLMHAKEDKVPMMSCCPAECR
jgi:hypothetical protein